LNYSNVFTVKIPTEFYGKAKLVANSRLSTADAVNFCLVVLHFANLIYTMHNVT